MKKVLFCLTLALLLPLCWAEKYYEEVDLETTFLYVYKLPKNVQEFVALQGKIAKHPKGALVMLILAAKVFTENEKEGMKCFTACLARDILKRDYRGYKGFVPGRNFMWKLNYLRRMPWAPNSYFDGTSQETDYKLPKGPWKFVVFSNRYSKRNMGMRYLIKTSASDLPRPFTARRERGGIWRITMNASSLFVGMKPPMSQVRKRYNADRYFQLSIPEKFVKMQSEGVHFRLRIYADGKMISPRHIRLRSSGKNFYSGRFPAPARTRKFRFVCGYFYVEKPARRYLRILGLRKIDAHLLFAHIKYLQSKESASRAFACVYSLVKNRETLGVLRKFSVDHKEKFIDLIESLYPIGVKEEKRKEVLGLLNKGQ